MRSSPSTLCLLSMVCLIAGCSQTGALRSSNTSDVRTIASVGDKPLPIVSGEPGASLRAETEDIERPTPRGSRISGRVYDERGKPVSDVKVRLAVGGAAGGKADIATTDRSGGFTLHGLRSGSSYTIIAEYEDEDGTMSGRAQAKAPETNVRIALQPRGGAEQGHASIRPARSKIAPISNIESSDEEPAEEINGGSGRRINAEDLEPPADEAAAVFPDDSPTTRRGSFDRGQSSTQSGWNVRQGGSKAGRREIGHAPAEMTAQIRVREPILLTDRPWNRRMTARIRCRRRLNQGRRADGLGRVRSSKRISSELHKASPGARQARAVKLTGQCSRRTIQKTERLS